ncbi:MAG: globin [Anaerolineae bacterium]|jgi:hemoglobin|nr:globin [Anaerolineae bacterium]
MTEGDRNRDRDRDLSVYEQIGGAATFWRLVDCFYAKVEQHPLLRPLFPDDLEEGKRWQALFLMQYWGGPAQYATERGHPRLRMRHAPFAITPAARDAWLHCMLAAIDETDIPEPARGQMRDYFEKAAAFMVNRVLPADDGATS